MRPVREVLEREGNPERIVRQRFGVEILDFDQRRPHALGFGRGRGRRLLCQGLLRGFVPRVFPALDRVVVVLLPQILLERQEAHLGQAAVVPEGQPVRFFERDFHVAENLAVGRHEIVGVRLRVRRRRGPPIFLFHVGRQR